MKKNLEFLKTRFMLNMKKLKIGAGMVITFNIMKYIILRNPMIKSISLDF
ncbi:hypothetical protein CNEO4_1690012 [Clostridium neonatale]|nr:hypothetical protein CNEO4_1690012 [Clostridium neonatale]